MAVSNQFVLLPSASRTVSTLTKEINSKTTIGVVIILDITVAGGAGHGLTIEVQSQLPATGEFISATISPTFSGVGTDFITVMRSIAESAGGNNQRFNRVLGDVIRVNMVASNAEAIVYSLAIVQLI